MLLSEKKYNENHDKNIARQSEYIANRIRADVSLQSYRNTRRKIHRALKTNIEKTSFTLDSLGLDIDAHRKLTVFQPTLKMDRARIEFDNAKLIPSFDVFNDEGMREAFIWRNTQTVI